MSQRYDAITPELTAWIAAQKVFFISTAPLAESGHVNCSPKGGDSFRLTGPMEAVYQDFTGSGAETVAHLRENGRILVMFCAFEGSPRIVRLHGRGKVITPGEPGFAELAPLFPVNPATRCFIEISLERVSDSCGYAVPLYDYRGPRHLLDKWFAAKTPEQIWAFRRKHTQRSIDGLPAFDEPTGR
jgi:hypothetical protein